MASLHRGRSNGSGYVDGLVGIAVHAFGLAILGLDRFEAVNDAHGHAVGDHVLRRTGAALARTLRLREGGTGTYRSPRDHPNAPGA